MKTYVYPHEVAGIAGLLRLDDPLLEQIRKFQVLISARRRVGRNVDEYRRILTERYEKQKPYLLLFPDSLVSVLYLSQTTPGRDLDVATLIGMISITVSVGQAFSEAMIFDLFVREDYRDRQRNITRQLVEHCHKFLRGIDVTRVVARLPIKRKAAYHGAYMAAGYAYDQNLGQLAYRLKQEG